MKKRISSILFAGAAAVLAAGMTVYASGEEQLYTEVIQNTINRKESNWTISDYMNIDVSYLPIYSSSVADLGYELLDVDMDGSKELLIGDQNSPTIIFDMYTLKDGQPVHVFSSLERDRYELTTGMMVRELGSSGAAHTCWNFYQFSNAQLIPQFGIFMDGDYDPYNPYFSSRPGVYDDYTHPLSNDDAEVILANYTERSMNLTPLTQWPYGSVGMQPGVPADNDQRDNAPGGDAFSTFPEASKGSTYEFVKSDATWTEASRAAQNAGGHLVVITSEEEQKEVENLMKAHTDVHTIWLGAERTSGKFKWVTGEKAVYSKWGKGEPNNEDGHEYYLDMYEIDGVWVWNDVPEKIDMYYSGKMGYIIEYEN